MEITVNVFVYGSLKKGFFNHSRIKKAKKVHDSSVEGLLLMDTGMGYPAAIGNEGGHSVYGEVYQMPLITFCEIARMEMNAGYTPITFKDSKGLDVCVFIHDGRFHFHPTPITSGKWTLALQNGR